MSDAAADAPPPPPPEAPTTRPGPAKGPAAFRTISEASAELGVPQHVLRFWETRFAFIRPTKRAGGRRFYRPQDLDVLRGVRALLQDEGYTIKGVQKLHKEGGLKRLLAAGGVGESGAEGAVAQVEAAAAGLSPPPPIAAPDIGPAGDEEDGPQTRDLFEEPDQPERAPPAEPSPVAPAAPPAPAGRPVLDASARGRLSEVLDDLETTKARIDALLA